MTLRERMRRRLRRRLAALAHDAHRSDLPFHDRNLLYPYVEDAVDAALSVVLEATQAELDAFRTRQ